MELMQDKEAHRLRHKIDLDIGRAKARLLRSYHEQGLCENWGQLEVMKLSDKYGIDYTYQRKDRDIDAFNDWCMNFTGQ